MPPPTCEPSEEACPFCISLVVVGNYRYFLWFIWLDDDLYMMKFDGWHVWNGFRCVTLQLRNDTGSFPTNKLLGASVWVRECTGDGGAYCGRTVRGSRGGGRRISWAISGKMGTLC